MQVKKRVALITGITGDIGSSIIPIMVKNNWIVCGLYKSNIEKARLLKDNIKNKNGESKFFKGDVTDRKFVDNCLEKIIEDFGRIDLVINNAGIDRDNLFPNMSLDEWNTVVQVNFVGTVNCSLSAIRFMKQQQSGLLINIASVTAVIGREGQSNYGMSKGAVIGFSRLLSRKYASNGIRINTIAPGMMSSKMVNQVNKIKTDNFLEYTVAKRLGKLSEISDGILAIIENRYLFDAVIKLDGGFMR